MEESNGKFVWAIELSLMLLLSLVAARIVNFWVDANVVEADGARSLENVIDHFGLRLNSAGVRRWTHDRTR
jgi:hypothetical protein